MRNVYEIIYLCISAYNRAVPRVYRLVYTCILLYFHIIFYYNFTYVLYGKNLLAFSFELKALSPDHASGSDDYIIPQKSIGLDCDKRLNHNIVADFNSLFYMCQRTDIAVFPP